MRGRRVPLCPSDGLHKNPSELAWQRGQQSIHQSAISRFPAAIPQTMIIQSLSTNPLRPWVWNPEIHLQFEVDGLLRNVLGSRV